MFDLIDQDSDGLISLQDLALTFKSVGEVEKSKDKSLHENMLKESNTELNFASFSTLMLQKNTLSTSDNLRKSFRLFDVDTDSSKEIKISEKELTSNLMDMKCGLDESQIKSAMDGYITEDNMNGERIFLGGRFINSVSI